MVSLNLNLFAPAKYPLAAILFFCTTLTTQHASSVEPFDQELFDEAVEVRRLAAETILRSDLEQKRASLPSIIESLDREKDSQVRLTLLEVLQPLKSEAAPATQVLLNCLKDKKVEAGKEEQHQDYRIAMLLAEIGQPSELGLAEILDNEKEHVRAYAAMALGRMRCESPKVIERLANMLADENKLVREEASLALGLIGPSTASILASKYLSESARVQVGILRAASSWDTLPAPLQILVKEATNSGEIELRSAAVKLVSRCDLKEEQLHMIYLASIAHENDAVRHAVIDTVLPNPAVVNAIRPQLLELLESSDRGVVKDCATLLTTLGASVFPELLSVVERDRRHLDILGASLARIGPTVTEQLIAATQAENPNVRSAAALALGDVVPVKAESIAALSVTVMDGDASVQLDSLAALGRLGAHAKNTVDSLRALINHPSPEVRHRTATTLLQVSPRNDQLVDLLVSMTADSDDNVQLHTINLLQTLGPISVPAIDVISNYLHDEPSNVRLAAAAFIASHGPRSASSLPVLQRMLDDPSAEIRVASINAIMQMRSAAKPALNSLIPNLDDPDSAVRSASLAAIASIEQDFVTLEPHLTKALLSGDEAFCSEGLRVISRMGKEAVTLLPQVISLAKKPEMKDRVNRSLRTFRKVEPSDTSLPQLIELAKATEMDVAVLALEFLGLSSKDSPAIDATLEQLSRSDDEPVRKAAVASLALRGQR